MGKVSSKYLELIRAFPLRPIRSEKELERAEAVLHRLSDARSLSAPEQDYLEILGNVIDEYESKALPIEPLPPHQMLAISIESKGVTQTEVSRARTNGTKRFCRSDVSIKRGQRLAGKLDCP
jgi:HTH-type transcriptional regulator / antitoxin HigA